MLVQLEIRMTILTCLRLFSKFTDLKFKIWKYRYLNETVQKVWGPHYTKHAGQWKRVFLSVLGYLQKLVDEREHGS
jgi:hypothetical protein